MTHPTTPDALEQAIATYDFEAASDEGDNALRAAMLVFKHELTLYTLPLACKRHLACINAIHKQHPSSQDSECRYAIRHMRRRILQDHLGCGRFESWAATDAVLDAIFRGQAARAEKDMPLPLTPAAESSLDRMLCLLIHSGATESFDSGDAIDAMHLMLKALGATTIKRSAFEELLRGQEHEHLREEYEEAVAQGGFTILEDL